MLRPASLLLLLCFALLPTQARAADSGSTAATTAVDPAVAIEEAAATARLETPAAAPAAAPATKRSLKIDRLRRNTRLAMGVVGLLLLWLLTRMVGSEEKVVVHHRHVAMNHEELGRLVFQAARSNDFQTFRELFLNAAEAAGILGIDAVDAYLESRSEAALREALAAIAARCVNGTVYGGVVPVNGGLLGLRVRPPTGEDVLVQIGTVTEIGGGCRLHLPAQVVAEQRAGRS